MTTLAAPARPAFGLPGRIQDPNSKPRSIAVVGLGQGGAEIARSIARDRSAGNIEVHVLAKSAAGGDPVAAIKAGGGDLQRDLTAADMIFIVARHGDDVALATVVSGIARSRNHPVTGLYIVPPEAAIDSQEDGTLRTLRSAVEMLVIVSDESYVGAMVSALGG